MQFYGESVGKHYYSKVENSENFDKLSRFFNVF